MDISGEVQRDLSHNVLKVRLDKNGAEVPNSHTADLQSDLERNTGSKKDGYCGSCYGGLEPASGCCNSCEEVRMAYVNRGWSFTNPDAIDQVSTVEMKYLPLYWYSCFGIVQGRRVGREAARAGRRGLQYLRQNPRQQGYWQHSPLPRTLLPDEPPEHL